MLLRPTDDTQLRENVIEEIANDPFVNNFDIIVSADDGVITLDGIVDTHATQLAVQYATWRTFGVRDVIDNVVANPALLGRPLGTYFNGASTGA